MNNLTPKLSATMQRLQKAYETNKVPSNLGRDRLIDAGILCGFCELPLKGSKSETCHCD